MTVRECRNGFGVMATSGANISFDFRFSGCAFPSAALARCMVSRTCRRFAPSVSTHHFRYFGRFDTSDGSFLPLRHALGRTVKGHTHTALSWLSGRS